MYALYTFDKDKHLGVAWYESTHFFDMAPVYLHNQKYLSSWSAMDKKIKIWRLKKGNCTLLQDNREEGAKSSNQFRAKSLRFPIN